MDVLRSRLDDIAAKRRRGQPLSATASAPPGLKTLQSVAGGSVFSIAGHQAWRIDTPFESDPTGRSIHRLPSAAGLPADLRPQPAAHCSAAMMIVDIETGGFSGTPVFLIGVVLCDRIPLRVTQFLARDYGEEEGILRGFARLAETYRTWVSFNGKSFDAPFLQDRAALHRLPLCPPAGHLDLLHAARRRWRAVVPNCKLTTLERHILGRARVGDVPSADVPDLFHHFMHTGNAAPLRPVLEHNQIDLVSCAGLLNIMASSTPEHQE